MKNLFFLPLLSGLCLFDGAGCEGFKNKKIYNAIRYITLTLIITFTSISCSGINEEEAQPASGCEFETKNTIPNKTLENVPIEEEKIAVVFFKDDDIQDPFVPEEEFNNRFWIFQGTERCYNCQRKFIVCNENLLDGEFDFLKLENNSDSVAVKFTGDLKDECAEPRIVPGDFFYAEIVLMSIEKIN